MVLVMGVFILGNIIILNCILLASTLIHNIYFINTKERYWHARWVGSCLIV
jgi:hypothetical protein